MVICMRKDPSKFKCIIDMPNLKILKLYIIEAFE